MTININNLMAALRGQESGGNYQAVNSTSGALGAYQIMPSNLPSWGVAAGYPNITPQQFLANPAAQDAIAQTQVQAYASQYGDVGAVAQAWYGGPGSVGSNVSGGAGYPTSNQYAAQVVSRYQAAGGDSGAPQPAEDGPFDSSDDPLGYSLTGDPNGASEFSTAGNDQGTPALGGGLTTDASPIQASQASATPPTATASAVQGPPGAVNTTAPTSGSQSATTQGGQPITVTDASLTASQGLNAVAKAGTQVGADIQQSESAAASTGTGWLSSIYAVFQTFAISSGLVLLGLILLIGAFIFFYSENQSPTVVEA